MIFQEFLFPSIKLLKTFHRFCFSTFFCFSFRHFLPPSPCNCFPLFYFFLHTPMHTHTLTHSHSSVYTHAPSRTHTHPHALTRSHWRHPRRHRYSREMDFSLVLNTNSTFNIFPSCKAAFLDRIWQRYLLKCLGVGWLFTSLTTTAYGADINSITDKKFYSRTRPICQVGSEVLDTWWGGGGRKRRLKRKTLFNNYST